MSVVSGPSVNDSVSGQEASDILAAALEQMDGIIARTKFEEQNFSTSASPDISAALKNRGQIPQARVLKLLDDLKLALELCDDKSKVIRQIPPEVLLFVKSWLVTGLDDAQKTNGYAHESSEDKAQRLEADKQSLMLQASVLTDQVEAQTDKLREMEYQMEGKRQKIESTEDMYKSELLSRSSLETHKLDLMAEISSLKIRLATADNERRELDDRLKNTQHHVADLEAKLALKEAETADLRQRLARNGTVVNDVNDLSFLDEFTIRLDREWSLERLRRKQYEVERLKKAVDALMVSNSEKDKRIDELRRLLRRYKKIEDIVTQAQGRKAVEELLNIEDDTSSTSSTTPSVSDGSGRHDPHQTDGSKPDRNYNISPSATSTPVNSFSDSRGNTLPSPPSTIASVKPTRRIQRSNSAEDLTPSKNNKTPPTNKRHTDVVKRNGSYAQAEMAGDDVDGSTRVGNYHPEQIKKKKGLLRFFGRLKRSGSQDFHERERRDEFRRGGVRATATARLGWSRDVRNEYDVNIPFSRWDKERIVLWMNDIGLNMYLAECRRWIKNGDQLLKATSHDLEKELSMRNHLHRKKLQLALQAVNTGSQTAASELDHTWVMRWLDDIGLPQYKDSFFDARVDGRMLHVLTVEDLLSLKVSNELHHLSIKRGIQVLRLNNYNTSCFKRRPSAEEGVLHNIPADVVLWTNHRVMEWLRTIDLSEYAPNLRGSGVHGALMVLENRFNAELFAQLLSIPNNKTLLRRHLNTHFVSLIGNETQHKKREQEATPGCMPLVPNAKVKKGKFGLFSHKRSKSETEAEGFICPMELEMPGDKLTNGAFVKSSEDPKAAQEIGAVSKEISSLTTLQEDDTKTEV